MEAKRRQEQLRKQTEDEQDETKRKINELQCDLLELRDAHAKLRTTNEKLRRERERYEKDREEMRQVAQGRRRADIDEDKKINAILNQVIDFFLSLSTFNSIHHLNNILFFRLTN